MARDYKMGVFTHISFITVVSIIVLQTSTLIMTKSLTKVIYKPDTQSTDEYIAFVNPEQYKKWKAGDTTIPLADVVDSFQIFHSGQGAQGILGQPSKQQLDTVFGTHKDIDCISILLQKGTAQASEAIMTGSLSTNPTRGSADNNLKGSRNVSGF